MDDQDSDPLRGISEAERQTMARLLRQSPEQHKAATKPDTAQAEAQRRRRQRERVATGAAPDAP